MPTTESPRVTTLTEVRDLATIPVFSTEKPNLAGLLGCSRWTVYADTKAGRWPSIKVGSRYVIPVPALRRVLGDLED